MRLIVTDYCHAEVRSISKYELNAWFMKKYRLPYLIFVLVVFTYLTVRSFYNFSIGEDKGMSMIGGILFGVMAIFNVEDLYVFIKNKKSERLNSAVKSTSES